jgi:cellulose synthase/poly-beta-1,6-N-acetylglucosamine synthase-like glycosyltransferase
MITHLYYISIAIILYVYIGYPFIIHVLSRLKKNNVLDVGECPNVSILIAAYNEEKDILSTVNNKLNQDYPIEKLEVIVISDGSTDKTDKIVEEIQDPRVKLLRQVPRAGKTSALNAAIKEATGEIVVFSDANSIYDLDAIKKLIEPFFSSDVGYVTGKMIYTNPDGSIVGDGCSTYMRYENRIREAESKVGSVVGVDGGIDAMRKELFTTLSADQLPDFVQPLKVTEKGYHVKYQPNAILKEPTLSKPEDEYKMRVRVTLRALWALYDMRNLLLGKAGLLFSWQIISHKVLRYLCFFFLIVLFISNFLLVNDSTFYLVTMIMQVVFYLLAVVAHLSKTSSFNKIIVVYVSYYFSLINFACAHAFVKFILGKKQITWTPRKG